MTDGKNRYVDLAVHCIGLDRKRPYARHNKRFYRPYRNYFASGREHEGWDVMVLAGYAGRGEANSHGGYMYYMTREGDEKMERLTEYVYGFAHGAEGVRKERLTGHYCRGIFEATACVEKLAEYENLEEQGRLLKLPCAVGDTVYHTCIPRNEELQIIEMKVVCVEPYGAIRNHKGVCEVWNVYAETGYTKEYFKFFDFGKTVFLAREEAETALKKLER